MPDSKPHKPTGLGRGFEALIPQDFDKSFLLEDQEKIQKVDLNDLQPNPDQPRASFDREALEQLASSIKRYGILQPLVVMPAGKGAEGYIIIAGERRWRAAEMAGVNRLPVIVRSSQELERLEIAIVENVQRVDLSPLEQAESIERLHQQFSMTYESIARRLGKASSTINNIVRLLQLPAEARTALAEQKISEGHARSILALKDVPSKQAELLASILRNGWSVRQAERFVTSVKEGFQDSKTTRERVSGQTPATKRLAKQLGVPVQIRRMAKGGRLEITFTSDEQLAGIMRVINS